MAFFVDPMEGGHIPLQLAGVHDDGVTESGPEGRVLFAPEGCTVGFNIPLDTLPCISHRPSMPVFGEAVGVVPFGLQHIIAVVASFSLLMYRMW
jgi:hypothetical protein